MSDHLLVPDAATLKMVKSVDVLNRLMLAALTGLAGCQFGHVEAAMAKLNAGEIADARKELTEAALHWVTATDVLDKIAERLAEAEGELGRAAEAILDERDVEDRMGEADIITADFLKKL